VGIVPTEAMEGSVSKRIDETVNEIIASRVPRGRIFCEVSSLRLMADVEGLLPSELDEGFWQSAVFDLREVSLDKQRKYLEELIWNLEVEAEDVREQMIEEAFYRR
jgi:hypothetical protein